MVLAVVHSPHTQRHLSPTAGDTTLEQLRQSLSRSPSKGPAFRLFTSRTSSPIQSRTPKSPPANRPESFSLMSDTPMTLFPVSARKRKPLFRSPMRITRGSLGAQRSPAPRRILQESSDNGNSSLQSMVEPPKDLPSPNEMQISPDENSMLAPHHALGRKEKSGYFDLAKSSPLKRSEANFDIAQAASPSAKRRSIHGSTFGHDFNILEHSGLFEQDSNDMPPPSLQYSPTAKRKSSLRRPRVDTSSRFDTVPAIRSRPTVGSIWDIQAAKARNRLSLDFPLPEANNDSPFSFDASQPPKELPTLGKLTLPPRHPLSRTITQSSAGSDIAEDSPTHPPVRHLSQFNRPFPEFTRSLPLGAARPRDSSQESNDSSFATPASYKLAKPHPAAFLSTGLISKKNRNLTKEQLDLGASIGDMPDTPCKRPLAQIAPIPAPTPNVNLLKARAARQSLHAFGTPSTHFNPSKSTTPAGFNPSIFGSEFNHGPTRRGSFAENSEEIPKSPLLNFHHRNRSLFDGPPTPTKQSVHQDSLRPGSFSTSLRNDFSTVNEDYAIMDSKSILLPEIKVARVSELDESCLSSPSPMLRFRKPDEIRSFSKRIAREKKHSPSPLSNLAIPVSTKQAKQFPTASPVADRVYRDMPSTPLESVIPPDPSNLSISGNEKNPFFRSTSFNDSTSLNLPATPTAARDSLGKFSSFGASVTPNHHTAAPFNVDPGITAKFDKVEPLSTGEFSQVWRVYSFTNNGSPRAAGSRRNSYRDTSLKKGVWAVKKAKAAYIGPKDRLRKLQEVEILRSLGQNDYTVHYFDHWEYQDHLYIQTEYCEEGTLQNFLERVGQAARLDDFRIWKIMLEMSKGLKHIHDSGFIHLDIKPANVLVSFEGVLKIADFGMASVWPAPKGIEGEGDREYIGPEILMGQFDKPADIFAFGLMMLEIAANVMLPDNGTSWQRLRSGDMSDVPSLTSSSDISAVSRDAAGNPTSSPGPLHTDSSLAAFDFGFDTKPAPGHGHRLGELRTAPEFMTSAEHYSALDKIVRWMISPNPADRPVVDELLSIEGVRWVESRRRAGATIFEGNFGPADEILHHDSEMLDV